MIFYSNSQKTGKQLSQILLLVLFHIAAFATPVSVETETPANLSFERHCLYENLHLAECGLKYEAFEKALIGLEKLEKANRLFNCGVISIADFSQSSKTKRLFIIDLTERKLLFQTWVAHGKNSGGEFAKYFSNTPQSYKSSFGFFVTGETYNGDHGLSLRLYGMEKGINDNAEARGIVIHAASYVSQKFINQNGFLGRSEGCPALSEELSNNIINTIKDGSCFYIYH